MVNLCNLVEKYSHFSKVDDDVFVYVDRILENAYEIYTNQLKAKSEMDALQRQLEEKRQNKVNSYERSPAKTSAKKRKIHSVETSLSDRKENISILEDSRFFPCKSDPETSSLATSILEQNILDSEESFFALSQSPPKREGLSPRNASESLQPPVTTVKPSFTSGPKLTGIILRPSRLNRDFASPPARSSSIHQQKSAESSTPKASAGQWTGKKQNRTRADGDGTPTRELATVAVKRFQSLADGSNRLRQTMLKFPEADNALTKRKEAESPARDDSLFSDFIVPTPPSVSNKSRFLRSLRMKKQSTVIDSTGHDRSAGKASSMASKGNVTECPGQNRRVGKVGSMRTFATGKDKLSAPHNRSEPHDDDYDIDQTYCSGAESFNRSEKGIAVKQEQLSQRNPTKNSLNISATRENPSVHLADDNSDADADSPGVIIFPPREETVVTIDESQLSENDIFMAQLNCELGKCNKAEPVGQAIVRAGMKRDDKQAILPTVGPTVKPQGTTNGRIPLDLCSECAKLYQFHTSCGIADDVARSKLPRHCRSCRLAVLHSTPPGFWNPDFLSTEQ